MLIATLNPKLQTQTLCVKLNASYKTYACLFASPIPIKGFCLDPTVHPVYLQVGLNLTTLDPISPNSEVSNTTTDKTTDDPDPVLADPLLALVRRHAMGRLDQAMSLNQHYDALNIIFAISSLLNNNEGRRRQIRHLYEIK